MACGLPSPWGPSLPFPYEDRGGGFKLFVIEGFHFSLPFFPTRRLGTGAWFSLLKALTSSHPSSLRGDWGGALLLVCPYLLPSSYENRGGALSGAKVTKILLSSKTSPLENRSLSKILTEFF